MTQRFDAVGDSTYDDPYGPYDDPGATAGYTQTGAAAEDVVEEERRPKGDGLRTALLLLLGVGIGFVAALVVVALFGGDAGDPDALALRDERIAELEEELEAAEQENDALEEALVQRDEQIADLQTGMDDAAADLAQREQALDDRERALDQREGALDDREQQLDEREAGIEQREEEAEEPPDDGQPDDGQPDPDPDLPDIDEEDAEAFIDRIIEGIRDLFR